jgi:predicted metalloprotease with PDZ domain
MALLLRRRHATIALACAIIGPVAAQRSSTPAATTGPRQVTDTTTYTVTVAAYDNRVVAVRAHIVLADSLLLMYPEGADHVPDSWATYIRDLTATDDAGHPVTLRASGAARWVVPSPRPRALNLRYEVLVHHDAGPWPFGSKEAAYARADCVFLTGKALFIAQYQTVNAIVRVVLPPTWSVTTPWAGRDTARLPRTPATPAGVTHTFAVPNVYELLDVGMLVGQQLERTIRSGGVTVTLAVGHDLESALPLFEAAVRPLVPAAAAMFGGAPQGKFVVIANRDTYDGGTSFTRSFSMVFKDVPTAQSRDNWGHVIAHEMLHLWNGNTIRSADGAQEYWFSEGFTDYLADLLEHRTGMITEHTLIARIGQHYDKYLVARAVGPGVSLRSAGDDKAKYYDLIYSGGLLTALALDVELRQRSAGRRGVEDLLRVMYRDFGGTGKPYAAGDIQRVAGEVAGADLSTFFTRYVDGSAALPMQAYFRALGLVQRNDSGAGILRRRVGATTRERELAEQVFGGSGGALFN